MGTTDVRVATLRRRIAAMTQANGADRPGTGIAGGVGDGDAGEGGAGRNGRWRSRGAFPIPEGMTSIFPHGVLDRGSVLSVTGAGSVLLGILAAASAADAHVAIVGMPALSMLRLVELGGVVDRVAVVPDPGGDPVRIAAVLLDGIDVVVLHPGAASIPPSRARAVTARVRAKDAILVVDGRWPGTDLHLEARVVGYRGVAAGHGRLQAIEFAVTTRDRSRRTVDTRLSLESVAGVSRWRELSPVRASEDRRVTSLIEGVS